MDTFKSTTSSVVKYCFFISLIIGYLMPKANALDNRVDNGQSQRINLAFQNTSVRDVLLSLAQLNQMNLVMSDDISGEITVELNNVQWQQALEMVLELKGYSYQLKDNILLVATAKYLQQKELNLLTLKQKLEQHKPLESKIISIHYAKAVKIAETLKASGNNILSTRGQVSVDERTNTLIIKDTNDALKTIEHVINRLDIPAKQVLIEARMVTIRDNADEQLGIQWGSLSENIETGVASTSERNEASNLTGKFNINLPVANPAGRFAIQVAKLADGTLLDLELSALERESKGEIIATPRILSSNQTTSKIEQGTEIPYLQAAAHGATSVAFKKAVLSLEVTPQITPNNKIILELNITQDARGESVLTSTGPTVAIDTQQIKTKVSVSNGETIVLGGIYQQQLINTVNKVPILGDIPYLGYLFRSNSSYNEKRELLVFVTPQIINSEM